MAGTEMYTSTLASGLHAVGNDISVVCVGQWDTGNYHFNGFSIDEYHGIQVTRVNLNWLKAPDSSRYLYDNPRVADFFGQHLSQINPDIVHVSSCDRLSASVITVAKQMGIPVVLTLTDFWFLCPRINLVRSDGELCNGQTTPWECLQCMLNGTKFYTAATKVLPASLEQPAITWVSKQSSITRQRGLRGLATDMADRKRYLQGLLRQADYVMIATEFGRRLFEAILPDKEIHVVPYGHDLNWLSGYSGKTPSSNLRIGYIGRLDESKGPQLLIEAFGQLPFGNPVVLSIHGWMPQNAFGVRLQSLIDGDPRITFFGSYAHEQSAEIFMNLDVLVIPSLWYDFPLVAHEALATKTVIVATDLPGLNEIVQNEITGLLFERANPTSLKLQLERILLNPGLTSSLRKNMPGIRPIDDAVDELMGIYTQLTYKADLSQT
jgi:glycosyltransferase involved in cell wall biosynthesis